MSTLNSTYPYVIPQKPVTTITPSVRATHAPRSNEHHAGLTIADVGGGDEEVEPLSTGLIQVLASSFRVCGFLAVRQTEILTHGTVFSHRLRTGKATEFYLLCRSDHLLRSAVNCPLSHKAFIPLYTQAPESETPKEALNIAKPRPKP